MLLKGGLSHLSKIALKNDVRRIFIAGVLCLNYFHFGMIGLNAACLCIQTVATK